MPRNTVARKPTGTTQSTTERSKLARQVEIIKKHREHECYNEIEHYDPYPYQKRFHGTGSNCNQRLLITGNRIGKSFSGATETVVTHAPNNIWDVVSQLGLWAGLIILVPLVLGILLPGPVQFKCKK